MSSLAYMRLDHAARLALESGLEQLLQDTSQIPEDLEVALKNLKEQGGTSVTEPLETFKSQLQTKMDALYAQAKGNDALQEAIDRENRALVDLFETAAESFEGFTDEKDALIEEVEQAVSRYEDGLKDLDLAEDLVSELDLQGYGVCSVRPPRKRMPIKVVIEHCEFTCMDCGHVMFFVAPLKDVKENSVIFQGKCIKCGSDLLAEASIEHDLLVPTDVEYANGVRPASGPERRTP